MEGWISQVLSTIAPLEKTSRKGETLEEAKARYASIAHDLAVVVDGNRPLFSGPNARYQTAALILSVAYMESGFLKSVSNGTLRGDSGRSWCYMQINIGAGNVYVGSEEMRTWKGQDLLQDNAKCFAAGLQVLRLSMGACRGKKSGDVLSAYTSGRCQDNEPKARGRWAYASAILRRNPVPKVSEQLAVNN